MTPPASRGDLLLHPVVLAALVVWAVNDHVLKEAWPGLVTGKLSDVAGVVVAPVILVGLYELRPGGRRAGPAVVTACVAAIALAFTMVELVPSAAGLYERTMGLARWPYDLTTGLVAGDGVAGPGRVQLWQDAPDLLTLPVLFVPLFLGLRAPGSARTDGAAPPRRLGSQGRQPSREDGSAPLGSLLDPEDPDPLAGHRLDAGYRSL